jgi:hypothetical protein
MSHNVVKRLPSGTLLVVESGYQTGDSIRTLNQQVLSEIKKLRAAHRPALILVDLSGITGHDRGSETEAVKTIRIPFDAMAIFTLRRADRLIINMLVTLNNARDRVRTFRTLPEARAWLEEFEPVKSRR